MATETLRPNAAGDVTQLLYSGGSANWDCVDEDPSDEDTSFVYRNNLNRYDLYNLPAHSIGSGVINFIKVYIRGRNTSGNNTAFRIKIKAGGTEYDNGAGITVTASYADYSYQWDTNPNTGVAWTWDDIDALQIGVQTLAASYPRCTQVYVEVDYTEAPTAKTSSDTGAGLEAVASGNPLATLTGAETGSGLEASDSILGALTGAETGSGVDAVDSLETPEAKLSSDAGFGVEDIPVPSAILVGSETGSGIEALIARLLVAFDTGSGAEASSIEIEGLLKALFASELGQGSDSLTAKIEMPTKGGGMKLWI